MMRDDDTRMTGSVGSVLTGCVCRSVVFSGLKKQWGTISVLYQLNLDEIRMKYVTVDDLDDVW